MTDQEIFTKAWQKAGLPTISEVEPVYNGRWIFSHTFAKAFWGEKIIITDLIESYELYDEGRNMPEISEEYYTLPAWQYHLQQMVLEENPIKYLEKFLEK